MGKNSLKNHIHLKIEKMLKNGLILLMQCLLTHLVFLLKLYSETCAFPTLETHYKLYKYVSFFIYNNHNKYYHNTFHRESHPLF